MQFGNRKFTGFLGAATVVIIAEYALVLSDSVIAGRVLGETALGAVNLLMPLFSGVSFFTWLLAVGTSIVCSEAVGRLQHDRASELAGQGLVASCLLGLALALALVFGIGPYFAFMAPDAETQAFALSYGKWYPLVACLESVDMLVLYLVYAYGGERDCVISYVAQTLVNIGLSYALCDGLLGLPRLGMAGISLGTVVAYLTGLILLMPALIGHRGGLRFAPRWLPEDFLRSLRASFGDASTGLFHAVLFFIVTKYFILHYGADSLPIAAVVFCIVRLTVFFNGVGIALQPLETVYYGEGNELAIGRLVRFAAFVSVAEGTLLTGLVLIAPELIVSLVGISDADLFTQSVRAVRLTVVGLVGYAITYLLNSHYQYVGCPGRSVGLTLLAFLGIPAALLFAFGALFGQTGVYLAISVGPLVALSTFLPFFRRTALPKRANMWSLALNDVSSRASVLKAVGEVLEANCDERTRRRLTDVLMLSFKRLIEANCDPRRVRVEVSLLFGVETVEMVVRDDGREIALDDLGVAVVHLPAAGFNRNVFSMPIAKTPSRLLSEYKADPRYVVVRGTDVSIDDVAAVIALDRMTFDAQYQVSPEADLALFKANPKSGLVVKDSKSGELVGYAMILPVREDVYQEIRSGRFIDTNLTPDMIVAFDHPGTDYRMYFASVIIHPKHRGAALLLTMIDAMVGDFITLAGRGIFGRSLTADAVSRDGEKMARFLGLSPLCKTNHGSTIYEAVALPPELRETTPSLSRLVGLYWEKFVKDSGVTA